MTTIQTYIRFKNLKHLVCDINGNFFILAHELNNRYYEQKQLSKKNNRIKYKGVHYSLSTLRLLVSELPTHAKAMNVIFC